MPKTIVRCSMPGCKEVALSKVAVPWQYGSIAELKTYGYACPTHTDSVLASARRRADAPCLAPDESVGELVPVALLER
jgi:hypothetical protein